MILTGTEMVMRSLCGSAETFRSDLQTLCVAPRSAGYGDGSSKDRASERQVRYGYITVYKRNLRLHIANKEREE